MLPGIFRLVNISRSAAVLFRYCNSSCASSSYFEKIQNFYQAISFQECGKSKENDQHFPLACLVSTWNVCLLSWVLVKERRVEPGTCFQITRRDKWWEMSWVCPGGKRREYKRGKREGKGMSNYLAEFLTLPGMVWFFIVVCFHHLEKGTFWERNSILSPTWSYLKSLNLLLSEKGFISWERSLKYFPPQMYHFFPTQH